MAHKNRLLRLNKQKIKQREQHAQETAFEADCIAA